MRVVISVHREVVPFVARVQKGANLFLGGNRYAEIGANQIRVTAAVKVANNKLVQAQLAHCMVNRR
jgi:hypothetical protein